MGEEGNERTKKMWVGLCGIRVVRGRRKKEKIGKPQRKKRWSTVPKKNGGIDKRMERERGEKKMRLAVECGQ